jgi:hypothetical protein
MGLVVDRQDAGPTVRRGWTLAFGSRMTCWGVFPGSGIGASEVELLRLHGRVGRPVGSDGFMAPLEAGLGRVAQAAALPEKEFREE